MNPENMLTKYALTQPSKIHKEYGWWRIKRDGCGLADVQNQHEGIKIVEELQRRADEVYALRAEIERLREEQSLWRHRLRIASAKMDGQHTWRLSSSDWPPLVGSNPDEVVRNALAAIRTQPLPAPPFTTQQTEPEEQTMHPVEIQLREAQPNLGDGYESRCLPDWIASLCKRWERGEGVQYDRNTMGNLLHTLVAAKVRNQKMAAEILALQAQVERLREERQRAASEAA